MAKKTSRKALQAPSESAESGPASTEKGEPATGLHLRGELSQLATLRGHFQALDEPQAAAFLGAYSEEACRKHALSTKAEDVFRSAMSWARTLAANIGTPGVNAVRVRWFFDCATALGNLLAGKATAKNPSDEASYDDVVSKNEKLFERTKRRLKNAAGSSAPHQKSLSEASLLSGQDSRAGVFRKLARLIKTWEKKGEVALAVNDVTTETAKALESAASEIEAATARRPAAQQADRDPPAVNEAEGRLLYAMRPLWSDLADAREDGLTNTLLTTSRSLLRGLGLRARKRKGEDDAIEDDDGTDA